MRSVTNLHPNVQGVLWLIGGMFIFSLQNIAIKFLNADYPVLQIVIIRSSIALPLTLLLFRLEGFRGLPKTLQPRMQLGRGLALFLSFTTYFMGVAALPLAEVASIRFSSPLIITTMSVFILGERVNWKRWLALLLGFGGILLVMRPGTTSFNLGSLFILVATILYSCSAIFTRRLKTTDSAATMAYYSTLVYIACAVVLAPIVVMLGERTGAHPSIAFLFHKWTVPASTDLAIIIGLGFVWASGMFVMARAYSLALASVAAPFEFATLPINIFWGFAIWGEIPTSLTWLGAAFTLISSLYILRQASKS